MNHSKQTKLENPERLAELNPAQTLERIGIGRDETVCDIGAGSGIFSVAAAEMTNGTVFALEIDDAMLELIERKARSGGLENIQTVKVTGTRFSLDDQTADLALLVTVLHEIDGKSGFLSEIKRILKANGRLAVIEFHKEETPAGPPPSHRLGRAETEQIVAEAGFRKTGDFDLGQNMFCMVFSQ